tara:strand:+ start:137 stop:247 length:111 start_codon:yes stop_codon:yes gene_type:complete
MANPKTKDVDDDVRRLPEAEDETLTLSFWTGPERQV